VEGSEGKAALVPSRSEIADAICTVQRLGGRVARAFALSFGDNLLYDDKLPTRLRRQGLTGIARHVMCWHSIFRNVGSKSAH